MPSGLDRLRVGVVAVVVLAGFVFCASATALSETSRSSLRETSRLGPTAAVLRYEREIGIRDESYYSDLRLTIVRQGQRLMSDTMRPTCTNCSLSPVRRPRSILVRDVTGDAEPEVIVDLYTYVDNSVEANEYAPVDSYYNSYVYSYVAEDNGGAGGYRRTEGRFGSGFQNNVNFRLRPRA